MFHKLITLSKLLLRGDPYVLKMRLRVNLAAWRLARAKGRYFIYRDFGFPMVCQPDWPDSVRYFSGQDEDSFELSLVNKWLSRGDLALDVGANIGLYTFAAASAVGDGGRVVSVDADGFIIQKIHQTLGYLHATQVTPVNAAITRENGTVTFFVRADRQHTGGQTLRPENDDLKHCTPVTVPSCTTQRLLEEQAVHDIPAFVKVDIEGAERMLLDTAPKSWFGPDGPLWIIEVNPFTLERFGDKARDITNQFSSESFECWLLVKHAIASNAVTLRRLDEAETFSDAAYYNFFAIPRGKSRQARVARIRSFFPAE